MTTQYSSAPASGCQVSDWGPETTVAPRWSDKPAIVRSALIGEAVTSRFSQSSTDVPVFGKKPGCSITPMDQKTRERSPVSWYEPSPAVIAVLCAGPRAGAPAWNASTITPVRPAPFQVTVPRTLTLVVSASMGQGVGLVGNAEGVETGSTARLGDALGAECEVTVGAFASSGEVAHAVKTRTRKNRQRTAKASHGAARRTYANDVRRGKSAEVA